MLNWEKKTSNIISDPEIEFKVSECISPVFLPANLEKVDKSGSNILKNMEISLDNSFKFENRTNFYEKFDNSHPINSNFFDLGYNLLLEGNNESILNYLMKNGFNETVDLIYIDPPFMKNTDFYKKFELESSGKEDKILIKLKQYRDKWDLSEYLQFIYERLNLLKSLLKKTGSIYVHLDESISHYVKIIMDEIFGKENFHRDIIWNTASINVAGFKGQVKNNWIYSSEHILFYTKSDDYTFNIQYVPRSQKFIKKKYKKSDKEGLYRITRRDNKIYLKDDKGEPMINIWNDILSFNYAKIASSESVFYPTQKPEALLERIIKTSSNPKDLVLDCFIGSGTTAAVAEKLNRRWIGCDVNKIAIHTSSKRIQRIFYNGLNDELKGNVKLKSNLKVLRYKIFKPQDEKNLINHSNFFDFEIVFKKNLLKIEILSINNKKILEFIKNSENISKSTQRSLQEIDITQKKWSKFSLVDSIFIDIRKVNESVFKIIFSDIPNKKNEKLSEKYVFDLKNCSISENFIVKVKIIDKFGNEYENLKKITA